MAVTRLLLVRHGESVWNAEGRLQGQLDPELSALGRRQVEALAPLVAGLRPQRCVSSDLARARQTAEILGYPEPELDSAWREVDVGDWSGRLAAEIDPQAMARWRTGAVDAPGGESRAAFLARVGAALDALAGSGGTVLVSTHGGCVRMACGHVTGADPTGFGPIPNASLSMIAYTDRPRLGVLSWVGDPLSRVPATDLASG